MAKDYYAILEVARTATSDQVRARFRELARERHPDRSQGEAKADAELEFQAITEAFNVLSDNERRRAHDQQLARPEPFAARGADMVQLAKVYLQRGIKAYREKNFSRPPRTSTVPPRPSQERPGLASFRSPAVTSSAGSRSGRAIQQAVGLEDERLLPEDGRQPTPPRNDRRRAVYVRPWGGRIRSSTGARGLGEQPRPVFGRLPDDPRHMWSVRRRPA